MNDQVLVFRVPYKRIDHIVAVVGNAWYAHFPLMRTSEPS